MYGVLVQETEHWTAGICQSHDVERKRRENKDNVAVILDAG